MFTYMANGERVSRFLMAYQHK